MFIRPRHRRTLQGKVVVITGASSGIGRAAALQFAAAATHLVLAARRTSALDEVAVACRMKGAATLAVTTDVTREADVERLVDQTMTRWGRIDVWVNNAGTTLFAGLDEAEFSDHRRVIETNLLAPMYVARLLVPIFRRQRAGTLINVGSVLSQVGQPFVPSYVISKFGLQGLSEAVRAEFADIEAANVCTILPYATDTPHFEDGGNAIGRRAHAMPPTQDPVRVAAAIVDIAARPRRLRYVPRYAAMGVALHFLLPHTTEKLLRRALERFHLVGRQRPTQGNLFAASNARGTIRGRRGPVVSVPLFAAWVAGELLVMSAEWFTRRHRPWPHTQPTR